MWVVGGEVDLASRQEEKYFTIYILYLNFPNPLSNNYSSLNSGNFKGCSHFLIIAFNEVVYSSTERLSLSADKPAIKNSNIYFQDISENLGMSNRGNWLTYI